MQETPGDEIEPTSERDASQKVPWRRRPRATFWDSAPSWRILQAAWAFPYIVLGVTISRWLGGSRPGGDLFLAVFSVIAILETVFLVVWLQRPVEHDARPDTRVPSTRYPNRDA